MKLHQEYISDIKSYSSEAIGSHRRIYAVASVFRLENFEM